MSRVFGHKRTEKMPRSACASAQSYQGFHCPLTELLDTKTVLTNRETRDDTLRMCRMICICAVCACLKLDETYMFSWRNKIKRISSL